MEGKNAKIDNASIAFILTLFGYLITYLYELGYKNYYGLPLNFINLNISTITRNVFIIITVIGTGFAFMIFYQESDIKNKLLSNSSLDIITNNIMSTSRYYKRFIFILVIVCVTIIITTNVLLFLQVIELVPNDNMSYYASTFLSLMQGPSGFLWLIRTITAIIIIVCIIVYYYFINNTTKTESNKINNYSDFHKHEKKDRINFFKKIKTSNLFLGEAQKH